MTHQPSVSRRKIVTNAAWAAPAIVVATAAPAMALSGRANVALTMTATRSGNLLTVNLSGINRNTENTGLTTTVVYVNPEVGDVPAQTATINSMGSSPGWRTDASTGGPTRRAFGFTRDNGYDGAPTSTGTATTSLSFTITVTPAAGLLSSGTLDTLTVRQRGDVTDTDSLWA